MFVRVSGFGAVRGMRLPPCLRNPPTNLTSVVLALVRWLSPHPDAILRDSELRPVCPPPFDINHALWNYSALPRPRDCMSGAHFERQVHLFDGHDADELRRARYDFVQLESIDTFMNCTTVDDDSSTVLETVTLPFVV